MRHQTVTATEFRAKCLALIDEVHQRGGTVTITKHGRPVAVLRGLNRPKIKPPKGVAA